MRFMERPLLGRRLMGPEEPEPAFTERGAIRDERAKRRFALACLAGALLLLTLTAAFKLAQWKMHQPARNAEAIESYETSESH